jgi:ABC-type proline/glycine betaine transport system ATPase subunit
VGYDADIYVMDEPFKSLDPEIKRSVVAYLKPFFADKTVAIISHDRAEADLMGACPYLMDDGVLVKTDL